MRAKVLQEAIRATTEDAGVCKTTDTRADFDGAATSVVKDTPFIGPAIGVPDPVGDRAVDYGCPDEAEDHSGEETAALSDAAHDDCEGDCAEHALVESKEQLGHERGGRGGRGEYVAKANGAEVADEGVGGGRRESEGEAPEIPLRDGDGTAHEAGPNHRKG